MKTIEQVHVVSDEDKKFLCETKKVIQGFLPAAEVLLYGSAARGTHGQESDYDVLVLTDVSLSNKEEEEIRDAVYDLQVAWGELISTIFHSREFWDKHPGMPFHQEVARDAIVL